MRMMSVDMNHPRSMWIVAAPVAVVAMIMAIVRARVAMVMMVRMIIMPMREAPSRRWAVGMRAPPSVLVITVIMVLALSLPVVIIVVCERPSNQTR